MSELAAARTDEARFEQLLQQSRRHDQAARRRGGAAAAGGSARRPPPAIASASPPAALARLKAGARAEEIAAARARVTTVDAQIATLDHDRAETTIVAPVAGIVSSRLVEPGELVAPGAPIVVLIDLDHAWANVYVEERADRRRSRSISRPR